jgi:hypothetical protein
MAFSADAGTAEFCRGVTENTGLANRTRRVTYRGEGTIAAMRGRVMLFVPPLRLVQLLFEVNISSSLALPPVFGWLSAKSPEVGSFVVFHIYERNAKRSSRSVIDSCSNSRIPSNSI